MVSTLELKKNYAQKAGTHEIKRLTNAGACFIIAHPVLRCTGIYPIILNF